MKKISLKKLTAILLAGFALGACACRESGTSSESGGNPPSSEKTPVIKEENGFFVQNGSSAYKIVVPENCDVNVTYAAEELQSYIMQSTNCRLPIVTDGGLSYAEDKIISVGKTVYQESADLSTVDYADLKTGGYLIKNFGDLYVVDAATKEGLLYGVYEFLNLFFNVEFLTYDYAYIESTDEVKSYGIDHISIPAFPIRDYYSYPVFFQSVDYGAKLKMNSTTFKASDKVNGLDSNPYYGYYYNDVNGNEQVVTREGHTIGSLLAVEAYVQGHNPTPYYTTSEGGARNNFSLGYFAVNPDWYAYNPSHDRANSKGYCQEEICYTNGLDANGKYIPQAENTPETEKSVTTKMIEICKKMISDERNANAMYLMLGHADFSSKCICDNCNVAYEKYGTFSGAVIAWVNEVIAQVKTWQENSGEGSDVKYVILAYEKSINAPVKENADGSYSVTHSNCKPSKDVIVKMAYRNCCYHSLWDENCEQNDGLRIRFSEWSAITENFAIWDYSVNFNELLWYLPNWGTIKDNYRYYKEIGVQHLISQGSPNEYNFYENSLHTWVSCKLMWDPEQDVNELIYKFNNLYFGEKYASYVNTYRDIFENHFAILDETLPLGFHAHTGNGLDFLSSDNYSLKLLRSAADVIQKAIDEVNADTALDITEKEILTTKLRSVKVTPQYMMLNLGLIYDEVELKNVAKDFFESVDILNLTYSAEEKIAENTFEEMRKLYDL